MLLYQEESLGREQVKHVVSHFLWHYWKTRVVSISSFWTDNENNAFCSNSDFINIKKYLICSSGTCREEAFRDSRKGRWWRGWIKGQQQTPSTTFSFFIRHQRQRREERRLLIWYLSVVRFFSQWSQSEPSQSQTMVLYQAFHSLVLWFLA